MTGALTISHLPARSFSERRTRSIWRWQLVLALSAIAIALGSSLLEPTTFADWRYTGGLILLLAVTLATISLPWHRVSETGVLAVPVIDIVAIGLMENGAAMPLSALWVFPIAWIATYFGVGVLVAALVLIGAIMLLEMFETGISTAYAMNIVGVLISLGFISTTLYTSAHRTQATKLLLQRQSTRVAHALHRVTEQNERNSRQLNSLDVGIARVGKEGIIEVSNKAFHLLYDLDELSHAHPARSVEYRSRRGEAVPRDETTIARAARGEIFTDARTWIYGLDGTWRALSATTRVPDGGVAAVDGLLLVVTDVTESESAGTRRDMTMRAVSHELHNPLMAVLGHADLLVERDDLSDDAREQVTVLLSAAERMERLLHRMLKDSDRTQSDDEAAVPVDLALITAASVEGFAPTADNADVTLAVELEGPLLLLGDAFRLRQVVDNILGNAIKYTLRGGRVTVRGAREHHTIRLTIADDGIGIPDRDLPRVFDNEFRSAHAVASGIPGTGLGMGIARDIVTEHRGTLSIASEVGRGTLVTVLLPALDEGIST